MYEYLTVLAALLHHIQCSVVIDSLSQKGVYVSDYCPKMDHCAEGAHVMCMYYNPNRIMGPRCNKPKNVSITPELATKLLEVSNAVRSKIALGKEKGKGGDFLPKGYGMFRLKWDNELATFAQVLANQCVLRHDMCRATKKFADPGQTAGLVRFTFPDWFPVSKGGHFTKPGLTASKLAYAITQTLKSWYGQKDAVTSGMITSYPNWAKNPNSQGGRLYLEMIYGPSTHMGCGISAYSEYAFYDNNAALNYNSVQVICNYSSRPRNGKTVYQTEPPSEPGYTIRCGCPMGMDEDADCLCVDSHRNKMEDTPIGREACSGKQQECKPSIVLLPIFTVEDAPPEKLIGRSGPEISPFVKKETEVEILDLYGPPDNNSVLHPMENFQQTNALQTIIGNSILNANPQLATSLIGNYPEINQFTTKVPIPETLYRIPPRIQPKEPQSVISGILNEVHQDVQYPGYTRNLQQSPTVANQGLNQQSAVLRREYYKPYTFPGFGYIKQQQRESVFSKAATFELPKAGANVIIPDVKPRKDFSRSKTLVENYLNRKRDHSEVQRPDSQPPHDLYSYQKDPNYAKYATKSYLNSAEEKIINDHHYTNNYLEANFSKLNNELLSDVDVGFREKPNDKLMNLLDKLEQEVNHIELDRNKKEIFNAKLRKIYGSVVAKPEPLPKISRNTELSDTDFDDYASDRDHHFDDYSKRHYSDLNDFKETVQKTEMTKDGNLAERKLALRHNAYTKQHYSDDEYESDKHDEFIRNKHDDRQIARNQNALNDKWDDESKRGKTHFRNNQYNMDRRPFYDDNPYSERNNHINRNTYNNEHEFNLNKNEEFNIDRKHKYSESENMIINRHKNKYNDENEIRTRHLYDKDASRTRHIYSDAEEKKRIKDSMKTKHSEDETLSSDRKRYYQEKLENIERKLQARNSKHRKEPQMRPVRPTKREEEPLRPGMSNPDPLYMPDRARFLHGF